MLAQSTIYSSIFYAMASFEWSAVKFLWYLFFMYFSIMYFTFYGMMTTAITPNHNVASIIAAPFYMLWNLFSGFMIPYKVIISSFHISIIYKKYLKVTLLCSHENFEVVCFSFYLLCLDLIWTEDTVMVEMVLLGKPGGVDTVRFIGVTVR